MKRSINGEQVYTTEEIADWLARYKGSGLSLERFARQQGIRVGRLHYWLYQRHRPKPAKLSGAAPVFQEVKVAAFPPGLGHWAAEVSLPTGVTVRLSAAAAPAWIGGVVKELRRAC